VTPRAIGDRPRARSGRLGQALSPPSGAAVPIPQALSMLLRLLASLRGPDLQIEHAGVRRSCFSRTLPTLEAVTARRSPSVHLLLVRGAKGRFFTSLSMPYQTLINLYLRDCAQTRNSPGEAGSTAAGDGLLSAPALC
jgi:hypothetical protein